MQGRVVAICEVWLVHCVVVVAQSSSQLALIACFTAHGEINMPCAAVDCPSLPVDSILTRNPCCMKSILEPVFEAIVARDSSLSLT